MELTQFLIFELGTHCNLSEVHDRCPNSHPDRYAHLPTERVLDDETIVRIARRMYRQYDFRGLVGWHYYNEPLLEAERMFSLMDRIQEAVPEARFVLWSNATLVTTAIHAQLLRFAQIHFTNYGQLHTAPAAGQFWHNSLHWHPGVLDERLNPEGELSLRPCWRIYTEFIIDHHGNVHICCYDWRGKASPGNVFTDDLAVLIGRWREIRKAIVGPVMSDSAPKVCTYCKMRPSTPALAHFVFPVVESIRLQIASVPEGVAVVFVSYRIPEHRLRDHFAWNDSFYRQAKATVYAVLDRTYAELPEYVRQIVFPESRLPMLNGKRCFSLCATKNAGIDAALADAAKVVIVTDVDVTYSQTAWEAMCKVELRRAVAPVYHLADSYDTREGPRTRIDLGCEGTVAMRAEAWRRIHFDERCVGYGADDGILHHTIARNGVLHDRSTMIWHIAHVTGISDYRNPGSGQANCWNRNTGFNPDNFWENHRLA